MARDRVAATVATRTREFAKRMDWTLNVPGSHGEVSNAVLLGYLAEQGRDFAADTRSLRDHVRLVLQTKFEGYQRAPNAVELKRVAAEAILAWIVARFDNKVRDIRIKRNAPAYSLFKRKHGFDSRPGIRTGQLRDAVRDDGSIKITE